MFNNKKFAEIATLKEKYTSVETEYKNKLIELIKVYFDITHITDWTFKDGIHYKDCTYSCVALHKGQDIYTFKWCRTWGTFYWRNLNLAPIELLEQLVERIKDS